MLNIFIMSFRGESLIIVCGIYSPDISKQNEFMSSNDSGEMSRGYLEKCENPVPTTGKFQYAFLFFLQ